MTDRPETLLALPPGPHGTGRIRYGAAMALYAAGRLSPALLEAYRIAAAADRRPPEEVLSPLGLTPPHPIQPDAAPLDTLLDEIAHHLAPHTAPGIAETRRLIATRHPATRRGMTRDLPHPYLPAALARLAPNYPALAHALAKAAPFRDWQPARGLALEPMGPDEAITITYAPLIGPTAFAGETAELGLLLLPPHSLCPDQAHPAPLLHLPLTGPHGWRFGPDRPLLRKPAQHPVWIDARRPHLLKAGPIPYLALVARLAAPDHPTTRLPAQDLAALKSLRLDLST
ncbi:hypothetical protein [Tabrizicola sp. M-4]|uniref:hypothetical protein n=1 Tax=Tabrizicola sp. M-4 TaxID=3055847 RepID=UPI003DA99920